MKRESILSALMILIPILCLIWPLYKIYSSKSSPTEEEIYISQVKEELTDTKKIIINKLTEKDDKSAKYYKKMKTIEDTEKLQEMIDVLLTVKPVKPHIVCCEPDYQLQLFNEENAIIATFEWSPLSLRNHDNESVISVELENKDVNIAEWFPKVN